MQLHASESPHQLWCAVTHPSAHLLMPGHGDKFQLVDTNHDATHHVLPILVPGHLYSVTQICPHWIICTLCAPTPKPVPDILSMHKFADFTKS